MTLYKYYPENVNSLKAIANRGFWCGSPLKQNDPNDSLNVSIPKVDQKEVIKLLLESKVGEYPNLSGYLLSMATKPQEISKHTRNFILNTFGACSFCENNNNNLLWAHYASNFTGFVIEFEFNPSQIKNHNLTKIQYLTDAPKLELTSIITSLREPTEDTMNSALKYVIDNLSVKDKMWEYEKEWRIWSSTQSNYSGFDKTMVKSVFFGIKCPQDYVLTVLSLLTLYKIDLEVKKMYFDNDGKIQFEDLVKDKESKMV